MKRKRKYRYLFLYWSGGSCKSVGRDVLPDGKVLHVGGQPRHAWWYLFLNEDGVYHEHGPDTGMGYDKWADQFPDNWIDAGGNLRGHDGKIILLKT